LGCPSSLASYQPSAVTDTPQRCSASATAKSSLLGVSPTRSSARCGATCSASRQHSHWCEWPSQPWQPGRCTAIAPTTQKKLKLVQSHTHPYTPHTFLCNHSTPHHPHAHAHAHAHTTPQRRTGALEVGPSPLTRSAVNIEATVSLCPPTPTLRTADSSGPHLGAPPAGSTR
jgi:hypothetical protein